MLRAWWEAATPWEDVNSVIRSPQPVWWRMRRRKTVSVTPAMGARTVAGWTHTGPMMNWGGTPILFNCIGERGETESRGAPCSPSVAMVTR